jgi:ribonuclease J
MNDNKVPQPNKQSPSGGKKPFHKNSGKKGGKPYFKRSSSMQKKMQSVEEMRQKTYADRKAGGGKGILHQSPKFEKPVLRIIPLGGMEQVTKNMLIYETENDIVILEMGLEFPDDAHHGVNYIIPDASYLTQPDKKAKIRGVVITHAHLDHIGAIPHIMPDIGLKIPIYGTDLTIAMIEGRQQEYGNTLNTNVVDTSTKLKLGKDFEIGFFHVNHTIPGTVGIGLKTPAGICYQTADWKIDHNPVGDKPAELNRLARLGAQGVLCMLCDALGSETPGYQLSETDIKNELETIFPISKSRIIVATYSSNLGRVQQIIELAEKHGKYVFVDGRSMKNGIEISQKLKYITCRPNTLKSISEVGRYKDSEILILCTGSQSEENAALTRIVEKRHKFVQLKKDDMIVFSSSVQNRSKIQTMYDKIFMQGADVKNYYMLDIHAGGHAKAEEKKLLIKLLNAKYQFPISGSFFMRIMYERLAKDLGWDDEFILTPKNADVIEFDAKENVRIVNEGISNNIIAIDGYSIGDVASNNVISERDQMKDAGTFCILIKRDKDRVVQGVDITTKGFAYVHEREKIIREAKSIVETTYNDGIKKIDKENIHEIKELISKKLERHFDAELGRIPLVLPIFCDA